MKIVCDRHIPFLVDAIRTGWPQVQICPMEPEQIDSSSVRDADVLVVRTRTRVDARLLDCARVRMVCTATIGFDHIDTIYCSAHGIRWMSCPGCNAQAVCDYIEEAIVAIINQQSAISNQTIGIIGVGHVGSLVARMAKRRGLNVLLNDPPRDIGVCLDEIAQMCDIITFHVPLDKTTYHLCNEAFLNRCKPGALIINAARGGVVDEQALLRSGHPFILDTWENEPHINKEAAAQALLASMHIAGYSVQGKRNASQMCLDAIASEFGLEKISNIQYPISNNQSPQGDSAPGWLSRVSAQLKAQPEQFESLRKNYLLR